MKYLIKYIILISLTANIAQVIYADEITGRLNDFPLGWYLSNTYNYVSMPGITNNDPYSKYYNTHIVYTQYNKLLDYDSLSINNLHKYLNLNDIDFIVDLPRYSTQYRILFSFDQYNPAGQSLGSLFKVLTHSDEDWNRMKDAVLNKWEGKEKGLDIKGNDWVTIMPVNDKVINRNNSVVYSYPDIVSIKYLPKKRYGLVIQLIYQDSIKLIITDGAEADKCFKTTEKHVLEFNNYSSISYNGESRKYSRGALFDSGVLTVDSRDSGGNWKTLSVNLRRLAAEAGTDIDGLEMTDIRIDAKNIMLGNTVFALDNEHAYKQCISVIKALKGYGNIKGFYACDEFEWKELLHNDRYNSLEKTIVSSNFSTGKSNNTLLGHLKNLSDYAASEDIMLFILSTGVRNSGYRSMLDEEADFLRTGYLVFDYYGYNDLYIDVMAETKAYADERGLKLIYVGDTYSSKTRKPLGFRLNKYRFFSPLSAGADGMFFYAYFSPVADGSSVLSDPDKMNIGYFAKLFSEYPIKDCISGRKMTLFSDKVITAGTDGDKCCIIWGSRKGLNDYYNSKWTAEEFSFKDDEIRAIVPITGNSEYAAVDVSPYLFSEGIVSDTNEFMLASYEYPVRSDNIKNVLNRSFNCLYNMHDMRVIMLLDSTEGINVVESAHAENDSAYIVFRYPQLIEENSMSIVCEDSLCGRMKTLEPVLTERNGIVFTTRMIKSGIGQEECIYLIFRDIWGNVRKYGIR